MSKSLLNQLLVRATQHTLDSLQPDGSLTGQAFGEMCIATWALCYTEAFADNPYHDDPALLDAIIRLGDFNARGIDDRGHYLSGGLKGWDEWRTLTWMEAAHRVRGRLDEARLAAWREKFIGAGRYLMSICLDMDTFDGAIPNHGIWGHAFLYRVGQLFAVDEFTEMAAFAMDRVLRSQTPDGCFRELQSEALMQGTPVTGYNIVSLMAVNAYYGFSGDPAALSALEKGWRWWYDFLLPDYSMPPTLDFRQAYGAGRGARTWPAYFYNTPEGRYIAEDGWRHALADPRAGYRQNALGFIALQYDQIEKDVTPREPAWPEYTRMVAEEAGVRRRHDWTAVLSGMTNYGNSDTGLRLWAHERQDCLSLHHRAIGLLIGSAHSMIDDAFSSFVFYQHGAAHYLPRRAYLKSTPPLDTLLLDYGGNIGALSMDTNDPDVAEITFSIHGEKGKRPRPGTGHPITAMAAKVHLPLRLKPGNALTWQGETRTLGEERLRLKIAAGEEVDFGAWSLVCDDCPWELRWPVFTYNPYALLADDEQLGLVEVILFPTATYGISRPTATFRVRAHPA